MKVKWKFDVWSCTIGVLLEYALYVVLCIAIN
jgi:hypothetical protein